VLELEAIGRKAWRVRQPSGVEKWNVPRRARPVRVGAGAAILGVTAGDGRLAMPLDERLTWIKLSREERDLLRMQLGLAS
jgi:hypothetical protein